MKHEPEVIGDAVDHNRVVHERALKRAIERNTVDEQQPPVNAIGDVPVVDMNVYSAAEREPALSTTGPLNWGGGDYVTTPAYVPSEPLHGLQSTPNVRGHGERMGVDEITR